jgi:hypothetical protein
MTIRKIKIDDSDELRSSLDGLYQSASQTALARWALQLSKHSFKMIGRNGMDVDAVVQGYTILEACLNGQARIHDVRQAGFRIHELAKHCDDILLKTALRVAGQAVGTGHMKEHAMVASDYAVKVVNLLFPGDREAVIRERLWQIELMKRQMPNEEMSL